MLSTEVKFSKLIDRADAGYYIFQETLESTKKNKNIKIERLGSLVKQIFRGRSPGREGYFENGVLILKSVNIGYDYIDLNRVSYVLPDFYEKNKRYEPKNEELIITSTGEGTIGRALLFLPKFYGITKCIITEKVTLIRGIDRNKISPYYLLVFFWTKYGRRQLEVYARGSTGRTELYPRDIAKVIVIIPPMDFQKKIENFIITAYEKRNLSDQKYEQAKQLIEKELKLNKLKLKEEKTFEAKFSDVKQTIRFDSEYYKPKYEQIINFLKKLGAKKLNEVVKISNKKVDPTRQPTKKFKYVELANVNPSTGEIENVEELFGYRAPSRARMFIKEGDILVASLSGSLDSVGLVTKELDKQVASTGFFVINSDNFYSEVLFLLFKTELLKAQLEQKTAGAIMTAVPKTTFGDLLITILPKSKQEKISKLVKESFSLRKESKGLLDKATQEVENLIETDKND